MDVEETAYPSVSGMSDEGLMRVKRVARLMRVKSEGTTGPCTEQCNRKTQQFLKLDFWSCLLKVRVSNTTGQKHGSDPAERCHVEPSTRRCVCVSDTVKTHLFTSVY